MGRSGGKHRPSARDRAMPSKLKGMKVKTMAIYELSERTKKSISNCVGMSFDKICNLSLEEEIEVASKKCGHKIGFSRKQDNQRVGRGSPYLAKRKFRTLEEVEKKIAGIR